MGITIVTMVVEILAARFGEPPLPLTGHHRISLQLYPSRAGRRCA
ncbi:MAG: hypothetical protein Q8O00_12025 [Holophaga sp.]|nr:hypothetical protein [Holophaga sp.]